MRLPRLSQLALPLNLQEMAEVLRGLMWRDAMIDPESGGLTGYLRAPIADGREALLFLYNGVPHISGSIESSRFVARHIDDFKAFFPHATSAEFCVTDPALFQCIASLFRQPPQFIAIPDEQVTPQHLAQVVATSQGESAIVIYAGDAVSTVFCQNGVPFSIYSAPDHDFPTAGETLAQVVAYASAERQKQTVRLFFFPDVTVPRDPAASGHGLSSYFGITEQSLELEVEESPAFVVKLRDRTLFQFPVTKSRVVIGRGMEADLILDNLSVSRIHAIVEKSAGGLQITDNNSANGLVYNGQPTRTAALRAGDVIGVGKYVLEYSTRGTNVSTAAPAASASAIETTVMVGSTDAGFIQHNGQQYQLTGMFFVVGSGNHVTLRIDDPQLAPAHFVVERRPQGYFLNVEGVSHPVNINGKAVQDVPLRHGDVITVANHSFTFVTQV